VALEEALGLSGEEAERKATRGIVASSKDSDMLCRFVWSDQDHLRRGRHMESAHIFNSMLEAVG
jgi:hypothetical protein